MKKLLAILLALIMPFSALAETYGLSISISTNEASFSQFANRILSIDPVNANIDTDKFISMLSKVLNGIGITLKSQDNATAMDVQLGGESIMDITVHQEKDSAFLTSSLMPGYILRQEVPQSNDLENTIAEELAAVNWLEVYQSSSIAFKSWKESIESTVMKGEFNGDAYDGGVICTTWVITDKDIAMLFSALMTDDLRKTCTSLLHHMGFDAEEIMSRFDQANETVAEQNEYVYMLRVVEDDEDQLTGLSLTIVHEYFQEMTLSLGMQEDGLCFVIGFGANEQNYWGEISTKFVKEDGRFSIRGNSREWVAEKSDAFAYIRECTEPLSNYPWQFIRQENNTGYTWEGSISEWVGQQHEQIFFMHGMMDKASNLMNGTLGIGSSPNEPVELHFSFGPAERIPNINSNDTICDLSNPEDAELINKLQNQFLSKLMARMIKRLPMDLLISLPPLNIPE